jgi:heme-degrading monooxygenase HmoA
MNIHIALYKWKASASQPEIEAALEKVEALAAQIPGIVEISTGENTSKYSEGYTHVILVRGENQAAIDAYRSHPEHAEAAQQIEGMEEHGVGVDFTTDSDR